MAPIERIPRPAARIILTDAAGRILLFRFDAPDRPPFWVLPGGALEPGEDYVGAARRELFEEVGLAADPGSEVARRVADFVSLEGVPVTADERYFRVAAKAHDVDPANHTALERRVMTQWRWFTADEIAGWPETIYPEDLTDLLASLSPTPGLDPG